MPPPRRVGARDIELLASHGRPINSEELKELDVHVAFEQKQEPDSAFMKVLIIITEATLSLHNQCVPLRSTLVMVTSQECGCYALLGCYRFCIPSLKS